MYRKQIILIFLFLLNLSGFGQNAKYYHKFQTSDSHIRLTDWRVDFEDRGVFYIEETIDNQDRAIELRLFENDKLYNSDCYDVSIIKFEYKKDSIIQYNMLDDSVYSTGIECGDVSKVVYILENRNIVKSINFIFYDEYLKLDLEPDFKEHMESEKEKNKNGIIGNANFIWGYQFSSSKHQGFLPVRDNFGFTEQPWYHYPYNEKSSQSKFAIQNSKYLHNQTRN